MHLVLKLSPELRGFPNLVFGKITVPNRDLRSQTVVIVDAMQQKFHSRRNWMACGEVWLRDNCQSKPFSHFRNPFGNFDEPFKWVSKQFAHSCYPFEKLNNLFSRLMNLFEQGE